METLLNLAACRAFVWFGLWRFDAIAIGSYEFEPVLFVTRCRVIISLMAN
jgi:hypothetical protein